MRHGHSAHRPTQYALLHVLRGPWARSAAGTAMPRCDCVLAGPHEDADSLDGPSSEHDRRASSSLLLAYWHIRNRTPTRRATQPTQARRPTTRSCSPFRLCHRTSRRSSVMRCPHKSLRVLVSSNAATFTASRSRCPSATRPVCVLVFALGWVLTPMRRSGQELDEHQRALPEPHGKPRAARRERQRPRRRQHAGAGRVRGLHPRRRVRIRRAGIARTAHADWNAASCPRTMYTRPAARARPQSRIRRTCCT
jgi:hypothetical protein